jgi:hypothetical protein
MLIGDWFMALASSSGALVRVCGALARDDDLTACCALRIFSSSQPMARWPAISRFMSPTTPTISWPASPRGAPGSSAPPGARPRRRPAEAGARLHADESPWHLPMSPSSGPSPPGATLLLLARLETVAERERDFERAFRAPRFSAWLRQRASCAVG